MLNLSISFRKVYPISTSSKDAEESTFTQMFLMSEWYTLKQVFL